MDGFFELVHEDGAWSVLFYQADLGLVPDGQTGIALKLRVLGAAELFERPTLGVREPIPLVSHHHLVADGPDPARSEPNRRDLRCVVGTIEGGC